MNSDELSAFLREYRMGIIFKISLVTVINFGDDYEKKI